VAAPRLNFPAGQALCDRACEQVLVEATITITVIMLITAIVMIVLIVITVLAIVIIKVLTDTT
jgi:hypothetical protein